MIAVFVMAAILLASSSLSKSHALSFSPVSSSFASRLKTPSTTKSALKAEATTSPSPFASFSSAFGESALQQVEWLGSRVAEKDKSFTAQRRGQANENFKVVGTGGSVYYPQKQKLMTVDNKLRNQQQVWEALANLEQDMQLLDTIAGKKPQLSPLEFTLLSSAVITAVSGPLILGGQLTEFLAPTAAALSAAITVGAEYTGKVAVANGKEVAASTIQCAAEAECFLANAERTKAVTPLCVGVGATAATLSLLVPVLLDSLSFLGNSIQLVTEIYLLCPLVSILSAAVAGLALQETRGYCQRAVGVGNRRFARKGMVGLTWLSSTEIVERKSASNTNKWKIFCWSVLPAPLIGALVPGALPTKTIVAAAIAAAESAYYLAQCESALARATDAVALKARSSAVCDTYANQGARSAAILPFTSALSALCAATTAALVELPFLEHLAAAGTVSGTLATMVSVGAFPTAAALFAAAASVSKARCEVDAEAASQAASTLALPYGEDEENDPILRPFFAVRELLRLTFESTVRAPLRRLFRRINLFRQVRTWLQNHKSRQQDVPNDIPQQQTEQQIQTNNTAVE